MKLYHLKSTLLITFAILIFASMGATAIAAPAVQEPPIATIGNDEGATADGRYTSVAPEGREFSEALGVYASPDNLNLMLFGAIEPSADNVESVLNQQGLIDPTSAFDGIYAAQGLDWSFYTEIVSSQ